MVLSMVALMHSVCAVIYYSNCAGVGLERLDKANVWSTNV